MEYSKASRYVVFGSKKICAAQNRNSWGLFLCTKGILKEALTKHFTLLQVQAGSKQLWPKYFWSCNGIHITVGPWAAQHQPACTDLEVAHFWIGSKNIWDAHFCMFLHVFLINEYLKYTLYLSKNTNLPCTDFWRCYTVLKRTILSCTGFFIERGSNKILGATTSASRLQTAVT